MRRAVGDAAGRTIVAQIKRATENLGYALDDWRPRELWYGRCASAEALLDLRERFAAYQAREAGRSDPDALAGRVEAIRATLETLARQIDELAAEIGVGDR